MDTADLHCDTISKIYYSRKKGEQADLLSNSFQVDIKKMKKGGYFLQNFAVFVDIGEEENPYRCAKEQIEVFRREMEVNKERIRQVQSVKEIEQNRREGVLSAVLTLEEGEICQGDLKKLEEFFHMGVRMMTFTWNYENTLAKQAGLTETGIAFLEKMEELGIVADVSHLCDAGIYDVLRYSTKPFAASHSNARALCRHKRNLEDDMIRGIADKGGVIGINYYGLFLEQIPCRDPKEKGGKDIYYGGYSRVERIADHILYVRQKGGNGCVALGSDFDGTDGDLEMSDCSKIDLLERELRKRGLSEQEVEDIFFRNALRVYRDCWR